MSQQPYTHIYLSPHYDDASLSCGGAIYQQVQAGRPVLVVTVCAASPEKEAPLSAFARKMHTVWGNPEDVVAARRAEDEASMKILGVEWRHLEFTDCIYRGNPDQKAWYYTSIAALFDQIHSADHGLATEIAEAVAPIISNSPKALIYAPLTVGHHVDHQLTHAAALQLRRQGRQVIFYEDYPYSDPHYPFTRPPPDQENLYTLKATLAAARPAKLQPQTRYLSEQDLRAKIAGVRAYGSQLSMLFGGDAAMEEAIRAYAVHVGQGRPAERVWVPA